MLLPVRVLAIKRWAMKDGRVCEVSRGSALVKLLVGEVSKIALCLSTFLVNLHLENHFLGGGGGDEYAGVILLFSDK